MNMKIYKLSEASQSKFFETVEEIKAIQSQEVWGSQQVKKTGKRKLSSENLNDRLKKYNIADGPACILLRRGHLKSKTKFLIPRQTQEERETVTRKV